MSFAEYPYSRSMCSVPAKLAPKFYDSSVFPAMAKKCPRQRCCPNMLNCAVPSVWPSAVKSGRLHCLVNSDADGHCVHGLDTNCEKNVLFVTKLERYGIVFG
jgi:hypothetical protein